MGTDQDHLPSPPADSGTDSTEGIRAALPLADCNQIGPSEAAARGDARTVRYAASTFSSPTNGSKPLRTQLLLSCSQV
jgi:hypothetical protein